MKSLSFRLEGRVQGVGFRAGTRRLAEHHGVAGWVRNVDDGAVEGRVEGAQAAVDAFLRALPGASPAGRVESAFLRRLPPSMLGAFSVVADADGPTADWPGVDRETHRVPVVPVSGAASPPV